MAERALYTSLQTVLSRPVRIVGISGSLRKSSFNSGLLRYVSQNTPSNVDFSIADLSEIPVFNNDIEDTENENNNPPGVIAFQKLLQSSDAILFSSTEYNYSMSGVLKNSIDWGSRGVYGNVFANKVGAIIGAGGYVGTARSQYHLRQSAIFLGINFITKPEITINAFAPNIFNMENGDLLDNGTQERVIKQVETLRDYYYQTALGQTAFTEMSKL